MENKLNQEPTQAEAKRVEMRPIIFSTPMVQAILAGRKTQTRRIIKDSYNGCWTNGGPHPCPNEPVVMYPGEVIQSPIEGEPDIVIDGSKVHAHFFCSTMDKIAYCPYGKVGDILYVRENYFQFGKWISEGITKKTKKLKWKFIPEDHDIMFTDKVDAIGETFQLDVKKSSYRQRAWYLRLARFMPKKYSRIFLKITGISVERLRDITEEDSIAEGVEKSFAYEYGTLDGIGSVATYRAGFKRLWENINGPESWEQNPWIWKISFERIEKPITEYLKQQ